LFELFLRLREEPADGFFELDDRLLGCVERAEPDFDGGRVVFCPAVPELEDFFVLEEAWLEVERRSLIDYRQ
jgi:hypothetical protein